MKVVTIGRDRFINFYKTFGIKGVKVNNHLELLTTLRRLLDAENISIILIERELADKIRSELARIKLEKPIPLIIETELKELKLLEGII